ncbi:MAG: hypothetical protein Q9166_004707 [cf. Caloplaca sp. 2 TL-2023]
MSATYIKLSQSDSSPTPTPTASIKKNQRRSNLLGSFFPSRSVSPTKIKCNPPTRVRGIVGADPGELSIRESMARKKAFQIESFENGDYGEECDIDEASEEDEKELEELRFLMALMDGEEMLRPLEGRKRAGRKKSFAARLLSRG